MFEIKQYFVSVATAAIVCTLLRQFLQGKKGVAEYGRKLCGIFLLFSLLSPLKDFTFEEISVIPDHIQIDAETASAAGIEQSKIALSEIIKTRVQSYILDSAARYDARLEVQVFLSEDDIPIPEKILLSGDISPYGKIQLQSILETNLGIPKENQIWI